MSQIQIAVRVLKPDSPLLQGVVQLADTFSHRVGFYPRSAFKERARKGDILVAISKKPESLLGYLMYYVARGRVVIQQLCVAKEYQKCGVGVRLVDELKSTTRHLEGISLHCAREFPAHSFWVRLGFQPISEKPGRGADRKPLTRFWFDYGHPDLFSALYDERRETTLGAVLDANVVFNLALTLASHEAAEAKALTAPWLHDEITLWITDELLREINKCEDEHRRKKSRAYARRFPQLKYVSADRDAALSKLKSVLPPARTESDESDRRHLATAIAGGAAFLVTQDGGMLKWQEQLRTHFDIEVLRPIELVTRIDEIRREAEYAPGRLAGSSVLLRRIGSDCIDSVIEMFLAHDSGERKSDFRKCILSAMRIPTQGKGLQSTTSDGTPLVLVLSELDQNGRCRVPVLRIRRHQLALTVARHMIHRCILDSVQEGCHVIVVSDSHLRIGVADALREMGFYPVGAMWMKLNLSGCMTLDRLETVLDTLSLSSPDYAQLFDLIRRDVIRTRVPDATPDLVAALENQLFPVRFLDNRIPNYIVPIEPRWATELFDEKLASEQLISADDLLSLQCENVFYRSARIPLPLAPAHVLWYVSKGHGSIPGPQSVRACSNVQTAEAGCPKDLFRKYNRLGVFDWSHVRQAANETGQVFAFRFGGTEVFSDEIGLAALRSMLYKHMGTIPPLSMPVKIPVPCFQEIHEHGLRPHT